jgi:NADH-quinone oxidoreductase subunit J
MEQFIFWAFAAMLVFAAGMVITIRNPVHAVLFLVVAFVASSGLWLLLEAEFLAIALVLVYVGAVMVLFLFVVMMLDINIAQLREGFIRYLPVGALFAIATIVAMGLVVGPKNFGLDRYAAPVRKAADYNNTAELGEFLYTKFLYPFEIAGLVLLVAIIAAIALTMRGTRQIKNPKPERQVDVRRDDRVRIVKMPAEKRT